MTSRVSRRTVSQSPRFEPRSAEPHRAPDIASCEIDALGEQGPAFAKKLQEAGVSVELHVWARAPHAFSSLQPESKLSQLLYAELVRVISDAFEGA